MAAREGEGRHPATPAHLQAAKERGDFARSHQLLGAVHLIGVLIVAGVLVGILGQSFIELTGETWSQSTINASEFEFRSWGIGAIKTVGFSTAALLGVLSLMAVVSSWLQTGLVFQVDRVKPDVSRLSPGQWWSKVFSGGHLASTLMHIPKIGLVLLAGVTAFYFNSEEIVSLAAFDVGEMTRRMFGLILKVSFQIALVLLFFGVIDFAIQWRARQSRLRMTDQELREELRTQGNSESLQHQRQIQRSR